MPPTGSRRSTQPSRLGTSTRSVDWKSCKNGPAKAVNRLRTHGRWAWMREMISSLRRWCSDAADLLAATKKLGAATVDQAAERLVERIGLSGTGACLQTKAAPSSRQANIRSRQRAQRRRRDFPLPQPFSSTSATFTATPAASETISTATDGAGPTGAGLPCASQRSPSAM